MVVEEIAVRAHSQVRQKRRLRWVIAIRVLEIAEDRVDREVANPLAVALVAPAKAQPVDQRLEQDREYARGGGRITGADVGVQGVLHFALDFHDNSLPGTAPSAKRRTPISARLMTRS
jgi:hypothetical protein